MASSAHTLAFMRRDPSDPPGEYLRQPAREILPTSREGWRALAASQGGVVTRAQIRRADDVSASAIDRLIRQHVLLPIAAGVFLVAGAPPSHQAHVWSAVLSTRGVLCGATAAELWGLVTGRAKRVHVLIPHRRRITPPPHVRLVRWRTAAPPTCVRDALPMTTARWTATTMLAQLPATEALRLADRALQRGWIERADLIDRLRRYPKRHGNTQLRRLLDATADGAAAESERRLHQILRNGRITGWHANYPVWSGGDLIAVVDLALVERRIAVEVDGMAYHVDVDTFRHDRRRQNALLALGWRVIRFTWADLADRPAYVQNLLRRIINQSNVGSICVD